MRRPRTERGLYLTKKVISAYPNGFCGAIITGPRGIGKSVFALNVIWEMYRELGYDEDQSWIKTLDVCKFTMKDVIDYIEYYAESKDKARCLLWDDAGVHASTMEWWTNRDNLKRLKSILDTIRTGVCSLLITVPNESSLTKILRDYDDYLVQIKHHPDGGIYRTAKGYLKRTTPIGQLRTYPKFNNKFYIFLPDWVFKLYMEKREAVLVEQIKAAKKLIKS